jgi:hypothetical protein
MSMLLFILHGLWSIIDDSGSVVSTVVSSHPALLSFHMLAGNLDRAQFRSAGAKAPGEIFDAEELLTALGPDHATFAVVTRLTARKLTERSTK